MEGISFHTQVEASRQPNMVLAVCLLAVLICVSGLLVYTAFTGNRLGFFLFFALPMLVSAIRNVSATKQSMPTLATLAVDDEYLVLSLPGTRRSGGGYIDQVYETRLDDVVYVRLGNGRLVLSSRVLTGAGYVQGREVVRNDLGYGDVTIALLDEDAPRVAEYLGREASRIKLDA